jgi:hypothetical protein
MGRVADGLAALSASATSPDGNILARSRAGELAELTFSPDAYERYTEPDLAHQLARTATMLYIDHERGVQRVMEEAGLRRATDPSQARDEAQRRYLEAAARIAVTGSGSRELVSFETAGMAHWQCRIADGTLRRLSEAEFLAEVAEAARDLLRKNRFQKALLKNEFFGSRLAEPARGRPR